MPFNSHVSSDIIQDSFSSISISSSTCSATTFTPAIPSDLYRNLLSSTNIPTTYVSPDWARNTSAFKYQIIEIKNASMPIPDSSETNVFDPAGFDVLGGEGLGPVEGSWKSGSARSDGVEEEDDRSPNSAEVSNEVPVRKPNLGPLANGAGGDIAGDIDHVTAEEPNDSHGQHSIATADKKVAIEKSTPAPPLGTPDRFTGLDLYSAEEAKEWIRHYTDDAQNHERKRWLKYMIKKHKDWIGLDADTGEKKALDYAAGTGFLSWALAPYFGEIVGIDASPDMVAEYNAIVTNAGNLKCKMRAVEGNIIAESPIHGGYRPEAPEVFRKNRFDLIALTLGLWSFYSRKLQRFDQGEQLMLNLDTLLSALVENGTFLVIEFHITEIPPYLGIESVLVALHLLDMEDIEDTYLPYTPLLVDGPLVEPVFCYMIRATKGKKFEARQKEKGVPGREDFRQKIQKRGKTSGR
ncbi:hypothetical protein N7G274_010514 [Stereocaulon virgatum]|uniref:Methyltransferase domain-containing protein n=1 Tax=Stereocaulon virgatum TaxID=373712 RepID=A0ABR3ZTC7_9LECA